MPANARIQTDVNGRHAYLTPADNAGEFRLNLLDRDPWTLMLHLDLITREQSEAANRHAMTWNECRIVPERTSGLSPFLNHTPTEIADRIGDKETAALRRFREAQSAIPVFTRSEVLNVCCYSQRPSNLRVLRVGLSALARHYRIG